MPNNSRNISDQLISTIERFRPFHDGNDKVWHFFLKTGRTWIGLNVRFYNGVYYCNSDNVSCEINGYGPVRPEIERQLAIWLAALDAWQKEVSRDPLATQQRLLRNLPLQHRFGLILRSNARRLFPEWCDFASNLKNVSRSEVESALERHSPEPLPDMTLARYLEYCRIAYETNPDTFAYSPFISGKSGMEYYTSYADGRHGGLLDIEPESPAAFSAWYHSNQHQGCHPWEIYRGGNSTHISLAVSKHPYRSGWQIALSAFSSTRLVEACRIAWALDQAGMPVEIVDRESYLLRLRDEDWIGILPEGCGISYGWHNFPNDYKVADCMYLSWFYEKKSPKEKAALRRILRHLVHWLPLRFSCEPAGN
ncbi:MAG: hypothetical protein A2511_06910 [Deltaproteobacteria bacterium RIFOXYD12_FULL_50_9]|nr:MAG: hypothetical protein A2511_06910 [Deltaproteobacteria bacterium RIFOXYD12_FULL_50_9]